jgi:hypothetical protein
MNGLEGSVRPVSHPDLEAGGKLAPAGPEHGTLLAYYQGCRCEPCREQKMAQRRRINKPSRFRAGQLTSEEAKYCQVCGVRTSDHPMKACWRELL